MVLSVVSSAVGGLLILSFGAALWMILCERHLLTMGHLCGVGELTYFWVLLLWRQQSKYDRQTKGREKGRENGKREACEGLMTNLNLLYRNDAVRASTVGVNWLNVRHAFI